MDHYIPIIILLGLMGTVGSLIVYYTVIEINDTEQLYIVLLWIGMCMITVSVLVIMFLIIRTDKEITQNYRNERNKRHTPI